jgi:hypothetical protein
MLNYTCYFFFNLTNMYISALPFMKLVIGTFEMKNKLVVIKFWK